jgi:hypothetical protein
MAMNNAEIDAWVADAVETGLKTGNTKAANEFAQALLQKAADDKITRPEMCCALALVMHGIVLAEPAAALLPYITTKVFERYKADDKLSKRWEPRQ